MEKQSIPFWEKYTLTVEEATKYFGIGDKKLRSLVSIYPDGDFYMMNGAKILIKRKQFERFVDEVSTI